MPRFLQDTSGRPGSAVPGARPAAGWDYQAIPAAVLAETLQGRHMDHDRSSAKDGCQRPSGSSPVRTNRTSSSGGSRGPRACAELVVPDADSQCSSYGSPFGDLLDLTWRQPKQPLAFVNVSAPGRPAGDRGDPGWSRGRDARVCPQEQNWTRRTG